MLRSKRYRSMTPTQLLQEFVRLIPNGYVHKGRDAAYLRRAMETNALDSVDILWAMTEFRKTPNAQDIPTFCRWVARNMALFDEDRLCREGALATELSHQRLPAEALPYYDLMYESIPDVRAERSFRDGRDALRSYVTMILGPA